MSTPNYICTVMDAFPQTEEEFMEDQESHDKLYPESNLELEKESIFIKIISLLTGKA